MPGGDGTGPLGEGPMTGRALGFCAGYDAPGAANFPRGRTFFGRGRNLPGRGGRGRGWRHQFFATGLPAWRRGIMAQAPYSRSSYQEAPGEELEFLKNQAESLKEELDSINERIKTLENQNN